VWGRGNFQMEDASWTRFEISSAWRPLNPAQAQWLGQIGDTLHGQLVKAGLAGPREDGDDEISLPLGKFLNDYI
jgi:hypothetical protein